MSLLICCLSELIKLMEQKNSCLPSNCFCLLPRVYTLRASSSNPAGWHLRRKGSRFAPTSSSWPSLFSASGLCCCLKQTVSSSSAAVLFRCFHADTLVYNFCCVATTTEAISQFGLLLLYSARTLLSLNESLNLPHFFCQISSL